MFVRSGISLGRDIVCIYVFVLMTTTNICMYSREGTSTTAVVRVLLLYLYICITHTCVYIMCDIYNTHTSQTERWRGVTAWRREMSECTNIPRFTAVKSTCWKIHIIYTAVVLHECKLERILLICTAAAVENKSASLYVSNGLAGFSGLRLVTAVYDTPTISEGGGGNREATKDEPGTLYSNETTAALS